MSALDDVIAQAWAERIPPAVVPDRAMHREMDAYIAEMCAEDGEAS